MDENEEIGEVAVSFGMKPCTKFNMRSIFTIKGKIIEFQLLLGDTLDCEALLKDEKPTPGHPIMGNQVIRFHIDDVTVIKRNVVDIKLFGPIEN